MLKLGILDTGIFDPKKQVAFQVIDELFEIVPLVEQLGYSRYWLGQHYESNVAWREPEVLLALLAGMTEKIKIGIAGVLLRLHNPLKVAHNYKLLEYLFDQRIDLGLAKGITSKKRMTALTHDGFNFEKDNYYMRFKTLMKYLKKNFDDEEITIPPKGASPPDIWVLCSGGSGIPLAIEFKTRLSMSLIHKEISLGNLKEKLKRFRDLYFESNGVYPNYNVCLGGYCTANQGKINQFKSRWDNTNFPICNIVGTPKICREMLLEISHELQVDELIFLNLAERMNEKLESYELLAEELNLRSNQVLKDVL